MSKKIKSQFKIRLQQCVCFVFFPVLYWLAIVWMRLVRGYSVNNKTAIREQFAALSRQHKDGLLICPNHLTFLDSMLLIWALASPWYYMVHFKNLCWNLPKSKHVKENVVNQVVCYLGKCLPIDTEGTDAMTTMSQASHLLQKGHFVMVFPEGTRSKAGRVDTENFVYGVGKLHHDSKLSHVLCVYIRGDKQLTSSKLPAKNSAFDIQLKRVAITSENKGRRAMRDISQQMINHLSDMETQYFNNIAQRDA